jgi:hypothetical protein
LDANEKPQKLPEAILGVRKGILAATYTMLTFHEFLAKKAVVLPNLFRIEPFIGLAQPIPLKPTIKRTVKPRHRLGGGDAPGNDLTFKHNFAMRKRHD